MLEIKGKVNTALCYANVVEDEAIEQIRRMCDYAMTEGSQIRIMPDVHAGKGCTIGTTMTITDKAVPNVVGVDIGCGMYTVNLGKDDIDFEKVDEAAHFIPSGREVWEGRQEKFDLTELRCYRELKDAKRLARSLGTLGGGNHFIEIDEAADGTKIMSVNLLLEDEEAPVIWRGPVIAGVVKQFWTDVMWGDLDYLFVDMPPGTGDVPLTVFQSLPVDGVVIVTSPQDLVQMIVKKAYGMAKQMNIPVLGIVENYSYVKCPDCGNMVFPKIAPAVIVGVIDGDRILMTKYADREYKKYALIAGFTEIGETAEQTVEREVMEEVGLHVKNIRYYKRQPWGYDSDLLLGYFCELAEEHKIELDETELSLAEWIDYKDVPDDPEGLSLTREMMQTFREKKKREHEELS